MGNEAFSGRVGRCVGTAGASGGLRALPLPQSEGQALPGTALASFDRLGEVASLALCPVPGGLLNLLP